MNWPCCSPELGQYRLSGNQVSFIPRQCLRETLGNNLAALVRLTIQACVI